MRLKTADSERDGKKVFSIGGVWGHHLSWGYGIEWGSAEVGSVLPFYGHGCFPEIGDFLKDEFKTDEGLVKITFEVIEVDRKRNPRDMMVGKVKFIEWEKVGKEQDDT